MCALPHRKNKTEIFPVNKTKEFFYKVSRLLYIACAPNIWFEDINFSESFIKFHDKFSLFTTGLNLLLILSEEAALYTQNNLSEKLKADRLIFAVSHPLLYMEMIGLYFYRDDLKQVLHSFTVKMKEVYNDIDIEEEMIRKAKIFAITHASFVSTSLFLYGVEALQQALMNESTFTTVIPAWPDVEYKSIQAGIIRVVLYVMWWILIIRVETGYIATICLMKCLSYQFKQTQSYFYSLNAIFEDETLSEEQKEEQFEKRLKVGLTLHSDTLRCTVKCEKITNSTYGGHMILSVSVLALLMIQMINSERTLVNVLAAIITASCVLFSSAIVMLTAGDVTEEASSLSDAMFHCGWHHCKGQSLTRVQRLLIIAIAHSQRPVIIKCLGTIVISYSSFLQITKMSYSMFSLLY